MDAAKSEVGVQIKCPYARRVIWEGNESEYEALELYDDGGGACILKVKFKHLSTYIKSEYTIKKESITSKFYISTLLHI